MARFFAVPPVDEARTASVMVVMSVSCHGDRAGGHLGPLAVEGGERSLCVAAEEELLVDRGERDARRDLVIDEAR